MKIVRRRSIPLARRRPPRPLVAMGGAGVLALGAAVTMLALGGVVVAGLGAVIGGGILLSGYWVRAKRNGVWAHVFVDSEDVVLSLAFPIPISLIHWALRRAPIDDEAAAMARMILDDPVLMETLRHDAIEIVADEGSEHVEVVIGPRRRHWRAFQFHPRRSVSQSHFPSPMEEQ